MLVELAIKIGYLDTKLNPFHNLKKILDILYTPATENRYQWTWLPHKKITIYINFYLDCK